MQRVKRDRHKLLYKAVSIPTRRATRLLHREIRRRLNKRELYVGDGGGRDRSEGHQEEQDHSYRSSSRYCMEGSFLLMTFGIRYM